MHDPLGTLERSIISNRPGQEERKSLAEQYPGLYSGILVALSLATLVFLFSSPVLFVYLAYLIPNNILLADDYFDVTIIFSQISAAAIFAMLSYYLWKLQIDLPPGRPLSQEDAHLLQPLLDEILGDKEVLGTLEASARDFKSGRVYTDEEVWRS